MVEFFCEKGGVLVANIADFTKAEFAFRDKPMQILSIGNWVSLILGAVVLGIVIALSRPVYDVVVSWLRGVPVVGQAFPEPATEDVEPEPLRILQ